MFENDLMISHAFLQDGLKRVRKDKKQKMMEETVKERKHRILT